MNRQPVQSSHIAEIGHDGDSVLEVAFKNGAVHQYPATADEYQALLNADSVGAHFHKHFRSRESRRVN
jgi:hypothetical protein